MTKLIKSCLGIQVKLDYDDLKMHLGIPGDEFHTWCNGTCVTCPVRPEDLVDQGRGLYHCPNCEMFVVIGHPHPTCAELDLPGIVKRERENRA